MKKLLIFTILTVFIAAFTGIIASCDSTTPEELHPPDTDLGGIDDIFEFSGAEDGGFTTIEFSRLLVTGDEYDNDLSPGEITIIWSYGLSDNIGQKHVTRGYGEITL